MAEFPARTGLFAIIVKGQPLDGQQPLPAGHLAEKIDHCRVSEGSGAAEWQAADGAQMVLELAGHATLDGPMSRVMHARRHLVRDEASLDDEELDGQHPDVLERAHDALDIGSGGALESRGGVRRKPVAQDAAGV